MKVVFSAAAMDELIGALRESGYRVAGPTVRDEAIVLAEIASAAELPWGWGVRLEAGSYRLRRRTDRAAFAHSAGPQSWKPFLHPPRVQLWSADRDGAMEPVRDEPPRYAFLNTPQVPIEQFQPPGEQFRDADAVLVLDTGTWNQLGEFGEFLRTLDVPKAVVDHHRTQDDLGATRFVDVTAEATGRLTYELIRAMNVPVSKRAAHLLFMALALDTGHANPAAGARAAGPLAKRTQCAS